MCVQIVNYLPWWVIQKASSSPLCGQLATSLLTTQYSGLSNRRSLSSGRSRGLSVVGSQLVSPKARAPRYIGSVARIWMTIRSPSCIGRAVKTYPWQNSVSVLLAMQRSLLSLTLRPRVLWKGSGVKWTPGCWKRGGGGTCSDTSSILGLFCMLRAAIDGIMSLSTSGLTSPLLTAGFL